MGIDPRWGAAGLTASAGFAAWIEFLLLRGTMNRRIGHIPFAAAYFTKLWISAAVAAGLAWGLHQVVHPHRTIVAGMIILIPYGLIYLGLTAAMGIDQTAAILKRLRR